HPSGSIFVQINIENVHHVRELLDEVFGPENFVGHIAFAKTSSATSELLPSTNDFIIWFARNIDLIKYRQLYAPKVFGGEGTLAYTHAELLDGTARPMTTQERADPSMLPSGAKIFSIDNLTS